MAKTTTIPLSVRDLYAHVLILCDYIEDMRVEPLLKTTTTTSTSGWATV